nr:hypothetical protein [Methanobrevibacter arboriphilus]
MKLKFVIISLLLLMFLSLGAVSAASSDIYVSTNGSDTNSGQNGSPYVTIDKAINSSSENDNVKIHLSEGNFTGNGNVNLIIDKNHTGGGSLTIIGAGINKTFIDGLNSYNIFNIGGYSNISLINITFINGNSSNGGAISFNGTLTIDSCSFDNNLATTRGGAIYSPGVGGEILTIRNSFFNNNNATRDGGAIYAYALANITNSFFVNNYAGYSGGSVYISGSPTNYSSIRNCNFSNSTAGRDGGSLYITYGSIVNNTFENSKTTGTSTSYGGGAICGGNIYLENNNMILCSAASDRGNSIKANGPVNNTIVTINDKNVTNPSFTLTATVTDDKGNLIDGNSITFYVNSTLLGNGDVINGEATLNVNEVLNNGHYVINGSSSYYPNIVNGNLNVNLNVVPSVYYVSPDGDDTNGNGSIDAPFKTLKKAIDTGFANGVYVTVYLLDGVYSGEGNINLTLGDYLGNLDIIGLNYNKTIFDGNGAGLLFNFGLNLRVNLVNLTVRNFNNSTVSGAIISSNGTNIGGSNPKYKKVSIQDCIFENNILGRNGAVVKLISGSVDNSQFINNSGTSLYIATGSSTDDLVLVNNSKFINNYINVTSPSNGVLYLGNYIILQNCIFINNSVYSNQGVVYFNSNVGETRNNQFINNSNRYNGGTIVTGRSQLSNNDIFENNNATNIISTSGTFINATFDNNNASNIVSGSGTFINGTFKNNVLNANKAIFYLTSGQLSINGCNFTNNNNDTTILISNGALNNVNLKFISYNSTSLVNNSLKVILELEGFVINGGNINFYLNGTFLGSAPIINNIAEIKNIAGFNKGIYQITGNSTNLVGPISQNGILNISANTDDSLVIYVGENGSDIDGNGSIDNPFATIQKAIDTGVLSTLNLTVFILPGTIKGLGNVNLTLPNYLNLTITGTYNKSIIDGEAVNWIFATSTLYDDLLITFSNLKIKNAKGINATSATSNFAGIIRIGNITLIDKCIFENNNGVSVSLESNGKLIINNSIFRANYGTNYGTCVFAPYATANLKIYNTIFENNTVGIGGAAVSINGLNDTIISGCTFKDLIVLNNLNFSSGGHGAILFRGSTANKVISILNCNFTNNTLDFHHTWDSGQTAIRPTINLINCIFNSSGGITGGSGNSAYYEALWKVINSSFINMKCDAIFRTENPAGTGLNTVDFMYLSFISAPGSIIQGCLFENTTGVIFGGSLNITDCVILNQVTLMKAWSNAHVTMDLNNNYWGFNNPYGMFIKIQQYGNNQYNVVTNLDYWIVPKLIADGKGGLSQEIKLIYTLVDDEGNFYNYDYSNMPIPLQKFNLLASDGTLSEYSGSLSTSNFTTIFSNNKYGNYTITATFENGLVLSLDCELYQKRTNTTLNLSKLIGGNDSIVEIIATVIDADTGEFINEGILEIFASGVSIANVTVSNGKAIFNWTVSGSNGPCEIFANYLGSETYISSSTAEIFTINTTNTNQTNNTNNTNSTNSTGNNTNGSTTKKDSKLYLSNFKGNYGKTTVLKATLKDNSGKAIVGRYVKFYVNNKYVGQAKTNSQGIASLNYKVASTGSLAVKTTFASDNSYKSSSISSKLSVSKLSKVKIKNSYAVKSKKIIFKTLLANLGPDKSSLVISYKLPKGIKLIKRSLSSGLVKYNKRTAILSWTVKNLKLSKSKSALLTVTLSAKKGKYYIKNSVKKSAGSVVSGNNALKNIKVK